jgi:epoxyqueuosine reductase
MRGPAYVLFAPRASPRCVARRAIHRIAGDGPGGVLAALPEIAGEAAEAGEAAGTAARRAVALGNWGSPEAVPALVAALEDEEPLVRGHAAWALGRIASGSAASAADSAVITEALLRRIAVEEDKWVRVELSDALASRRPKTGT